MMSVSFDGSGSAEESPDHMTSCVSSSTASCTGCTVRLTREWLTSQCFSEKWLTSRRKSMRVHEWFSGKPSQERLRVGNPLTCSRGSIIHPCTLSSKQPWLHYKCRVLVLLGARCTARTSREVSGARGGGRSCATYRGRDETRGSFTAEEERRFVATINLRCIACGQSCNILSINTLMKVNHRSTIKSPP